MTGLLSVPYVSQLGAQASKYSADCGAACGVMLIQAYKGNHQVTVDQFYNETGRFSGYLWVSHITSVLSRHGVPTSYHGGPISDHRMRAYLDNARPMIVLFNYGVIQRSSVRTYDQKFKGSHFAVLVGADSDNVFIHDPLWRDDSQGKNLSIPLNIWNDSWGNLEEGNSPRTAIIPDQQLGDSNNLSLTTNDIEIRGAVERMRVVYARGMNVREGPGTNHLVVDALDSGSTLSIVNRKTSSNEEWGRIGYNRWVAIKVGDVEYLTPISFSGSTKDHKVYEVVSEYGLNVRKGTGIEFPITDRLPHGVMVNVMKKTKVAKDSWGMIGENQWIALKYDGQEMAKVTKGYRIG